MYYHKVFCVSLWKATDSIGKVMIIVDEIKRVFKETPSNLQKIRELITEHNLTKDELAELAIDFTDNCFCEYSQALNPECEFVTIETMCSNHIVEAIEILLEFGLDSNTIIDDDNAMWNTMWIDAPNIGAEVLRLLLENGGDPNHLIPSEGETLFEYSDFKVSYDEYTHDYFYTVQCWLVLMAYGACWSNNGEIPLEMIGGNSVEIFKSYELYDYYIESLPQVPGKYGCWIMHIYNIETKEEVAVYK